MTTDITIPPEALEATARQIAGGRLPEYEWVDLDAEMKAFYRDEAHAAITIAIKAWPGMRDSQHMSFDGRVENVIILPLQEPRT